MDQRVKMFTGLLMSNSKRFLFTNITNLCVVNGFRQNMNF